MLYDKEENLLTQQDNNLFDEITYVESPVPELAYDSGL
jgi:hypothetical protein